MKTVNARTNRIRHRRRLEDPRAHMRKFDATMTEAALQMNAIGGVAGVTTAECVASITNNLSTVPAAPRLIRAEMLLGNTTAGQVQALGIPIA